MKIHYHFKLILVGLLTLSVSHQALAITYVIVDPARDMNWYLKNVKRYLIAAEREMASIDKQISSKLQTIMLAEQGEANASAIITAQTTAQSITQNNKSEERYSPLDSNLICSSIEAFNEFDSWSDESNYEPSLCSWRNRQANSSATRLSQRFVSSVDADGAYYSDTIALLDGERDDKTIIRELADDIQFYSKTLNEYELINESDAERLDRINELVFMQGATLPNPQSADFKITKNNVDNLIPQVLLNNTYRGIIDTQIKSRTSYGEQYAPAASLIQSRNTLGELNEDISTAEYKDDAIRLLALTKTKNLKSQFNSLESTLNKEVASSLKLKALNQ